jgi:MarR family transcriptional regulator for hemolysin
MPAPSGPPIGLDLARTARTVSRAFDDALNAAGGSLPEWLVLISLKSNDLTSQRELAETVGIRGATLTHHLTAMEADGLISRRRDPADRRIQHVTLTPAGERAFRRMRRAAVGFDQQLRDGFSSKDITVFAGLLARLRVNVTGN